MSADLKVAAGGLYNPVSGAFTDSQRQTITTEQDFIQFRVTLNKDSLVSGWTFPTRGNDKYQ